MQVWFFANWDAQHGLSNLTRSDASGWQGIGLSLEYRWLYQQLNPEMTQLSESVLLLAHLWAIGDQARTDAQAQRLDQARGSSPLWRFSRFGHFLLSLRGDLTSQPSPDTGVGSTAMGSMYATLHSASASVDDVLAPTLSAACDYHLEQALTQQGYPEFALSPYDLLPIEMLLIDALRRRHGLELVHVAHPLLAASLLLEAPAHAVPAFDPDIDKLLARARDAGIAT